MPTSASEEAAASRLVFIVDDLEADMATLRERGLELGVVDESPWGRMLTLHDIDGNALVLHQP